jgi:hypothetical protein
MHSPGSGLSLPAAVARGAAKAWMPRTDAAVAHEIEAKRLGFVQARDALVVAAVVLRVRDGEGRAPDPPAVDESALMTRRGSSPYAGYVKSVTAVKAAMGDAAACTQRLTTR